MEETITIEKDGKNLGELYREITNYVHSYGTEAKIKFDIGLDFITLTVVQKEKT